MTGSNTPRPRQQNSLLEHILRRAVVMPDGCWMWQGARNSGGYGIVGRRGKYFHVHTVSYEAAFGPIPPGMVGDHRCHRLDACAGGKTCPHRACLNPTHLVIVTRSENSMRQGGTADRAARARARRLEVAA